MDLNSDQQLFVITMEECGELIQECSKILRHGMNEKTHSKLIDEIGDVEEVARTLSKARKHGSGMKFPQSAIKANPDRFRPAKRVDESFFFADVDNEVICDNCGHTWEMEKEDPHPHLCHMCAYDQKKEDFDIDAVIDFWTEKNK